MKGKQAGNPIEVTPSGIHHWVDDECFKETPQPGNPESGYSTRSSGGGGAHVGQLRSLIDNEKKSK